MKTGSNPISPAQRLRDAPRCHATAKSTGQPCEAPAVNGWSVCRVHGAGGGAPRGKAHGNWRHGGRSLAAIEVRQMTTALVRMVKETVNSVAC